MNKQIRFYDFGKALNKVNKNQHVFNKVQLKLRKWYKIGKIWNWKSSNGEVIIKAISNILNIE